MKTREKISIILNSLIFIFTLFATISMIIGFKFMGQLEVLSERNFKSFKYFTVDSNVFAGHHCCGSCLCRHLSVEGSLAGSVGNGSAAWNIHCHEDNKAKKDFLILDKLVRCTAVCSSTHLNIAEQFTQAIVLWGERIGECQ